MARAVQRSAKSWLLAAAWLCVAPAFGQGQDERLAIRAAIESLQAEQQALYQQFQMLQALQLNEQRFAYDALGPQSGPPRNYEDVIREHEDAAARATAYQIDMDELYERHRAIEQQKQPLLERLRELSLQPPAP